MHFNKGLAGAAPEVVEAAAREASINPQVADAFALAIIAMAGGSLYPELASPEPRRRARTRRRRSTRPCRRFAGRRPDAGCYISECDYFLADWRKAQWGDNWPRLEAIKRRYDPDGLFIIHHGVGSEDWSEDGFQRA